MTPRRRILLFLSLPTLAVGLICFQILLPRGHLSEQTLIHIADDLQSVGAESGHVSVTPFTTGAESASLPPNTIRNITEFFHTDDPELAFIADATAGLPDRFSMLEHWFGNDISVTQLTALLDFLHSPVGGDAAAVERERALRNGLLNALREKPEYAELAVPSLARQAADPLQDAGLRDYALQHLAAWVPELEFKQKEQAVAALQAALADTRGTYAGTALLGLTDLHRRSYLGDEAVFNPTTEVIRIASDARYGILSRLSALALATELGVQDADLAKLAQQWTEGRSLPEGARRSANAYLKTIQSASK